MVSAFLVMVAICAADGLDGRVARECLSAPAEDVMALASLATACAAESFPYGL